MKVGETIWTRDPRDSRKPWEKHVVTGETKISWLVQTSKWSAPRRVKKKTMCENLGQWGDQRWYSDEDKTKNEFISNHRRNISNVILGIDNVEVLRSIAALAAYKIDG